MVLVNFESLPIENYLTKLLLHSRITAITADIRADPAEMMKALAQNFKEIGLFYVHHYNEQLVFLMTIEQLKTSPEIANMVRKAILIEETRKSVRS